MRIEAAVVRAGSPEPAIETLELEAPRPGEVLVRIAACGVCHTDLRVAHLEQRFPRPIVLGHEGAGTVEAVGEGVEDLELGDPVLLSYAWCGACPTCRAGDIAYCDNTSALNFGGLRADGSSPLSKGGEPVFSFFGQSSFATHAVCARHSMIKAPADLPLQVLAPLGCGVQTGAGAVLNSLKVGQGQTLAVFGVGSVGLSAVMAAKLAGAAKIVAVDVNPARLALALELGATHAVDPAKDDPAQSVIDITGRGADFALNTTDIPAVYLQGIACLAPKGAFGFVTSPRGELVLDFGRIMLGGRTVRGIVQGDSDPRVFIPRLIDAYRDGRFPLDRLVQTYPFERVGEAMRDSEAGRAVKPVLWMDG